MTRRTRARRGEGDRLHDEILDAAEAILSRTGDLETVSIRAVAEAVGVTPPSIYLHFADRDALLFAVCERAFVRFSAWIDDAVGDTEDALESLLLQGRAYVRFGLENPEQYRVMFMNKPQHMPPGYDWGTAPGFACFRKVGETVATLVEEGRLRAVHPHEATLVLWTAVHGLTSALLSAPVEFPWPEDKDALVEATLQNVIRGLRPEPVARPSRQRDARSVRGPARRPR